MPVYGKLGIEVKMLCWQKMVIELNREVEGEDEEGDDRLLKGNCLGESLFV